MHRHRVSGNNLNRSVAHRDSLLRNLSQDLINYGAVETTLVRARAMRRDVEKMITRVRKGDLNARRYAYSRLYTEKLAKKLVEEVAPLFKNRPGGYTRVIKLGPRVSDGVEMARVELVEQVKTIEKPSKNPVKAIKARAKKVKKEESNDEQNGNS